MEFTAERFSGHESFVCRYGWLRKVFDAVNASPEILKKDAEATERLGIGRNMVRSLQFWGEATGVIQVARGDGKGHVAGPTGRLLFNDGGWDPFLEKPESLWLLHWWLSANANIAAWNVVFGDVSMARFEKADVVAKLTQRGAGNARALAQSTVEQHTSIFLQSYVRTNESTDDSLWCPLQDLKLVRPVPSRTGATIYDSSVASPIGLSVRVFTAALAHFFRMQSSKRKSLPMHELALAKLSPGAIFRLDEPRLYDFLQQTECLTGGAIRLIDTADTQSVVCDEKLLSSAESIFSLLDVIAHV
ncbi:DUF4007 family protein [Caballeronia sp. LZ062]|uniref:DUF4007 family protein n=1 Tax=unclassified Caballeronia TaxID=2646786 RepID=UPI002860663E|nr:MULTISPECIES: DUF4007 family protein [unclassified Caballeronia]MDR5853269.1 DUF4007 family protein [Caballeronia sp. LZ050]MDR5872197.1 DUF4007 family protein [Caballeronia sp. LZ062]